MASNTPLKVLQTVNQNDAFNAPTKKIKVHASNTSGLLKLLASMSMISEDTIQTKFNQQRDASTTVTISFYVQKDGTTINLQFFPNEWDADQELPLASVPFSNCQAVLLYYVGENDSSWKTVKEMTTRWGLCAPPNTPCIVACKGTDPDKEEHEKEVKSQDQMQLFHLSDVSASQQLLSFIVDQVGSVDSSSGDVGDNGGNRSSEESDEFSGY
eukprot:CAMPEP_0201552362 /NCGR_PEP_ID=MMETSP0173_2-20130828/15357_1 /ASSEMBLY_ACC=CAM_ASM_000268 /TAXON_ID=218659 /ORGANISM="Vexillifera sp., Strain DIVA3 564/2" /LENGTH=212 /DNA_ID=CAMNT_0047962835 /DNA_START=20 /DNA_END=658 /DNA_ORIENTATION=+